MAFLDAKSYIWLVKFISYDTVFLQALLLKETFNQLNSELYALQHIHTDPEELNLAVEIRLLLFSLTLQQGKAALR